eukprot:1599286-Amphidinium_carterae.2
MAFNLEHVTCESGGWSHKAPCCDGRYAASCMIKIYVVNLGFRKGGHSEVQLANNNEQSSC